METETLSTAGSDFQLQPPELLQPVGPRAARTAVPLSAESRAAVEEQVERFLAGLLEEDVQGEGFKARLDGAFALGREEVSVAASLMQGRLLQRSFAGMEDTPAFAAIQQLRQQLDALNPGRDGDLLQPRRLLGFLPGGNRLQAWFRKYQGASAQLQKSMQQLYAARDDLQRDVVELEATRGRLWDAMQKLAGAIHFAQSVDERLRLKIDVLRATDGERARALEQEVLFYVRQNLQDMLTQQAVCTNGYLALDVLKKTGRELMNGCTRVATTGMSALAVATTLARATDHQVKVIATLHGVNQTVEGLIAESGRQLNTHVERTTQFAQDPMVGIEKLKEMFEQTFKAMDAMDSFRAKAVEVMGRNNEVIREQLANADRYVDRVRQQQVRAAARTELAGPVAL